MKQARRETPGPVDPWVLRGSRESQDCRVSMVSAEDTEQPTVSASVPWWRAALAEAFG